MVDMNEKQNNKKESIGAISQGRFEPFVKNIGPVR
jgi:hypothetical protein